MQKLSRRTPPRCSVLALWLAGVATACSSSSAPPDAPPDGAVVDDATVPDAAVDAPPDGAVDGAPDGAVDAPPDGAVDGAPDGAVDGGQPDGAPPDGGPTTCVSPFVVPLDPGAEAAARAALAELNPKATLTWAATRGTLRSISDLSFLLQDCTGDHDVNDDLFAILRRSPALFQLDPAEWQSTPARCADIFSSGFQTVILRRTQYGPYPLGQDVFSAVVRIDAATGFLKLMNFSGTYVHAPSAAVLAALAACPDKTPSELDGALRGQPFSYERFAPTPAPACTFDGTGTYTAAAGDTLTYDPEVRLQWEEADQLTVRRQASATLMMSAANHTPELLNSDANCADEDQVPHVGWIRYYDTVSGAVLFDHDNPDPFCVVCFQ